MSGQSSMIAELKEALKHPTLESLWDSFTAEVNVKCAELEAKWEKIEAQWTKINLPHPNLLLLSGPVPGDSPPFRPNEGVPPLPLLELPLPIVDLSKSPLLQSQMRTIDLSQSPRREPDTEEEAETEGDSDWEEFRVKRPKPYRKQPYRAMSLYSQPKLP